jgi:hypothetical protein
LNWLRVGSYSAFIPTAPNARAIQVSRRYSGRRRCNINDIGIAGHNREGPRDRRRIRASSLIILGTRLIRKTNGLNDNGNYANTELRQYFTKGSCFENMVSKGAPMPYNC